MLFDTAQIFMLFDTTHPPKYVTSIETNPRNEYFLTGYNFSLFLQPNGSLKAFEDQRKQMFNPLPARQDILQSLEEDEFDILVIGGGATGTGVALDSVTRGGFLSVSSPMNSSCIDLEIE